MTVLPNPISSARIPPLQIFLWTGGSMDNWPVNWLKNRGFESDFGSSNYVHIGWSSLLD